MGTLSDGIEKNFSICKTGSENEQQSEINFPTIYTQRSSLVREEDSFPSWLNQIKTHNYSTQKKKKKNHFLFRSFNDASFIGVNFPFTILRCLIDLKPYRFKRKSIKMFNAKPRGAIKAAIYWKAKNVSIYLTEKTKAFTDCR